MDFHREWHIRAISIDEVVPGVKIQEAFQHMQLGSRIGKVVLQFREPTSGELQLGQLRSASASNTTVLDGSASYLLVGGLGSLGRSVAVWMVQHGARHLTFLSRSAGTTDRDRLFVEEIQIMGCEVHLVRGSVTEATDVAHAVVESPRSLKGVIQMAMVFHDQTWRKMTIDERNGATAPKVRGTWNLHNETQSLDLDFFILFSSLSGSRDRPTMAAQTRFSMHSSSSEQARGLLSRQQRQLRRDVRMSVFRNIRSQAKGGASSDGLRQFLDMATTSPETLSKPEPVGLLAQEIGKKLLGLVLRPVDGEIDASLSLTQLRLDSIVIAEMRA
ncbi:hypothetical protein FP744_10003383 [Trichoderma asperellum]